MHAGIHTYSGQSRGCGSENKLFPSPCLNFPFFALSTGSFYFSYVWCQFFQLQLLLSKSRPSSCLVYLRISGAWKNDWDPQGTQRFRGEKDSGANLSFLWLSVLWAVVPVIVGLSFSTTRIYCVTTRKKKKEKQDNTREDLKGPSQCWHVITLRQNCASACPISSLICK